MTDDEKLLLNRIKDLAEATYTQNRYSFSQFLTVEEQTLIYSIRNEIKHVDYDFFGGYEVSYNPTNKAVVMNYVGNLALKPSSNLFNIVNKMKNETSISHYTNKTNSRNYDS